MENRIRQLREETHMTQVRLAIELEVSQETISAYESGKNHPTITNLLKLSDIFHVSCDYILGLTNTRIISSYSGLSGSEQILLEKYRRLDHHCKDRLLAYVDGMLEALEAKAEQPSQNKA